MKSLRDARREYLRTCRRERRGTATYREGIRRLETYRNLYNAKHPPNVFRLQGIDEHGLMASEDVTVPAFGGVVEGKIRFRTLLSMTQITGPSNRARVAT